MFHLVVATRFQNVHEPDHVALHVGVRIRDGIADTRLRSKVNDLVEFLFGKKFVNRSLIGDIHADKARTGKHGTLKHLGKRNVLERLARDFAKTIFAKPSVLETNIVIVVDVVEPDDFVATHCKHSSR